MVQEIHILIIQYFIQVKANKLFTNQRDQILDNNKWDLIKIICRSSNTNLTREVKIKWKNFLNFQAKINFIQQILLFSTWTIQRKIFLKRFHQNNMTIIIKTSILQGLIMKTNVKFKNNNLSKEHHPSIIMLGVFSSKKIMTPKRILRTKIQIMNLKILKMKAVELMRNLFLPKKKSKINSLKLKRKFTINQKHKELQILEKRNSSQKNKVKHRKVVHIKSSFHKWKIKKVESLLQLWLFWLLWSSLYSSYNDIN